MKKTNVYVDGFNLYYGSLKNSSYKWLNLFELCRKLLPKNQINHIKYFSAVVSARPRDPDQPTRQQAYWRALRTIPNLSIIEGRFLSHPVLMPLAEKQKGQRLRKVWVMKTEEKGSDVNLASHLINDGYKRDYEVAVLITNDSDLTDAMRIVREDLKLQVGIINPHQTPSFKLQEMASFIKSIRPWVLKSSQFSEVMRDSKGEFYKPKSW